MHIKQYKTLVEKEYGPVNLPITNKEVEVILCSLDNSLESVSKEDFHILQAMLIVENWRNEHVDIRGKNHTNIR